jgi:hypothetical protein
MLIGLLLKEVLTVSTLQFIKRKKCDKNYSLNFLRDPCNANSIEICYLCVPFGFTAAARQQKRRSENFVIYWYRWKRNDKENSQKDFII